MKKIILMCCVAVLAVSTFASTAYAAPVSQRDDTVAPLEGNRGRGGPRRGGSHWGHGGRRPVHVRPHYYNAYRPGPIVWRSSPRVVLVPQQPVVVVPQPQVVYPQLVGAVPYGQAGQVIVVR